MATLDVREGEAATILASAARTATPTVDTFHVSGDARGLILIIDATAVTATPSVVFTVLGVDPVSGKTWTILASAAVATVSTVVLRVHPELTASANLIAKDVVPSYFTVSAVHGDADSITYSVAAQVV